MMYTIETTRQIHNPVQDATATYVKTAEETFGEFSLLEIAQGPHNGDMMHRHTEFDETYEVMDGELTLQIGAEQVVLRAGDSVVVPRNTPHCFTNTTDHIAVFMMELRPGHAGFEDALRVIYGLAADGKMDAAGRPKSILETAYLVNVSGSRLTGPLRLLEPLFGLLARIGHRRGVNDRLSARYLGPF